MDCRATSKQHTNALLAPVFEMWFETQLCPVCVLASGIAAIAAVMGELLKPERMIPKRT